MGSSNQPNYELIAVSLGDTVKWGTSVKEIARIAKATLKIVPTNYPHPDITSTRAQMVYDWVMSLANSSLPEEEKKDRLRHFIVGLLPEGEERKEFLQMLGETKLVPSNPPDFEKLVQDATMGEVLKKRWDEIQKCLEAEAYLAAIVMMGSLLEGVLLAVILSHPEESNAAKSAPRTKDGKVRKFHEWSLTDMIKVAHECGWIESDVKDFSLELRDYRNMVHPRHQCDKSFFPDADTAAICWKVVEAAMNDLVRKA